MTPVDIGIIAVIAFSAIIGLVRGLTRELLGLISWLGAAVLALLSLPALKHIARDHISNPQIADGVTIFVSFIALLIAFSILSHVISGFVKDSGLSGLDRFLGLGFGVLRGVLILSILEIGLSIFVGRENYPKPVQQARFTPTVIYLSDSVLQLIPNKILDSLKAYAPKIQTAAAPATTEPLQPQTDPLFSPPQVIAQAGKAITEKTVDALAQLKPQAAPTQEDPAGYQDAQRRDMDRLVQTTE